VFKNNLPTDITAWGMIGMVFVMAVTIHLYAKKRKRDKRFWQHPKRRMMS
jgi:putative membrane protein